MRKYPRNARFWFAVRHAFTAKLELWNKGSEARALLDISASDQWLEIFLDHAPASRLLSPNEMAHILVYKLLLL
jgi:hypothetical protein